MSSVDGEAVEHPFELWRPQVCSALHLSVLRAQLARLLSSLHSAGKIVAQAEQAAGLSRWPTVL